MEDQKILSVAELLKNKQKLKEEVKSLHEQLFAPDPVNSQHQAAAENLQYFLRNQTKQATLISAINEPYVLPEPEILIEPSSTDIKLDKITELLTEIKKQ